MSEPSEGAMHRITRAELAAMPGVGVLSEGPVEHRAAVIDSRAAGPGDVFFALRGARDGHEFCAAAVAAGATALVVARPVEAPTGVGVYLVTSPEVALGRLGADRRRAMSGLTVVAVTGSAGKTTTKELLAAMLTEAAGGAERVHATLGNLNNHLGVPLTLLGLRPEHRFAVIELGMSALREIAYLAELAAPDVAAVTLVAPAHLEQLGSIDHVAIAKGEIFGGLRAGGFAVLPDDDGRLIRECRYHGVSADRCLEFGESAGATAQLLEITAAGASQRVRLALHDFDLDSKSTVRREVAFDLSLPGRHNAHNAAAAAAVGVALGLAPETIARGLSRARAAKHRSQVIDVAGRIVLADLYNANPASTAAALRTLAELAPSTARVAVLGDMLELGPTSEALHAEVGRVAAQVDVSRLVCVGALAQAIARGARDAGLPADRVLETTDRAVAAAAVLAATRAGDAILVKGSRGMRLEEVVERMQATSKAGGS